MKKKTSCKEIFLRVAEAKPHNKSFDLSTNTSDINLALEAKLQSLQDHQRYLTVHYTNKIKSLMAIMQNQNKVKGQLTRELRELTHQLSHQKHYTQILKAKVQKQCEVQSYHNSELMNSQYYGEVHSIPIISRQNSDGYRSTASRSPSARKRLICERTPSTEKKQFCFNKKRKLCLVKSMQLI